MPMASVKLKPGVNTQLTPSLNEAGVTQSQLIRYKDALIQKIGGWSQYYPIAIGSTIKDIHAWQGVGATKFLGVAATQSLSVINSGSLSDITPQTRTSDFSPAFSVSSGSNRVTVVDAGSSVSVFDTVFFNTPVNVGGVLLQGSYPVDTVLGTSAYQILATTTASAAVASSGLLPVFTTTANSGVVSIAFPSNGYQPITGLFYGFYAPTSVGGLTLQGPYTVNSVVDSTQFTIISPTQASSAGTATMNNGLAEIVYYKTQGPPSGGTGYGVGGYGLGGYGLGSPVAGGSGTPITATDWTTDNWGEVLLACVENGPIYTWSPNTGFTTASVIPTAPFFNGGIFVSMPQQILVCWRSTQSTGVQDNLTVRWSDSTDYNNWEVSNQTDAGSFHIPTGSIIMGGMQGPSYGVIWTDLDAWIMQYVGGQVVFNFTRIGSGCGLIGKHAAGVIGGNFYWCGMSNFFMLGAQGVQVIPCTVWDFIFQNLNTAYEANIRCAVNSAFNEVTWFFPSSASTSGINDSYVKYNVQEREWDYGTLSRQTWTDISPLGNPIGTDTTTIYQHEVGYNNVNAPIMSSFTTGYWAISEGNDLAFVDFVLPDMKFTTYSGTTVASVQITFSAVDYPGDTPRTYGPYTFTNTTEYINTRIRGRLMSMTITTNDSNTFWRIGNIRYRWAPSGRR